MNRRSTILKSCSQFLLRLLLFVAIFGVVHRALAGGGPENLFLVVNSNSLSSKTIANHYISLRKIPPINVFYLDWRGGNEECGGIAFSDQILKPIIDEINKRRLTNQIDYVVYSSDFPWRVNLRTLFPNEKFGPQWHPFASLTGATYLWQYVRDKNPAMVLPVVNSYLAPSDGQNSVKCQQLTRVESRGFRSSYLWARDGSKAKEASKGQAYLLSAVLGVTSGRGNTVDEVLAYLTRSVPADGTKPQGTFYFMKNNDIRSQTRHNCYESVASQLNRSGFRATVQQGTIPQGANEVLGIMTGVADFNFAKSGSTLLPGAIGDHLTSFGGELSVRVGQTPLTEFLRFGAAGASGTVFEPMALQSKFALPSLFLHYARGCSLAESFYQSVAGPYQLLIVGDPLCQPFAVAPGVAAVGIQPGQEVKGMLTIRTTTHLPPLMRVGKVELFVDGRLVVRYQPGGEPQLDTTKLADGYHELRVVAVNADPIESRGRVILPLMVNNHGSKVELSVSPTAGATATEKIKISARQPGAAAIIVKQNDREVARIAGEAGKAEVLAATFGRGPVTLIAESEGPQPARSQPIQLEIR